MFRIAVLLMACSMSMTIVTCSNILIYEGIIPAVNRLDMQCRGAGHAGLCSNLMRQTDQLDCAHIICARYGKLVAKIKRPVDIGLAANGTHCGQNRICLEGLCVSLPADLQMPKEVGGSVNLNYECAKLLPGKPVRMLS